MGDQARQPMFTEDPRGTGAAQQPVQRSGGCFPFEPFHYCPVPIRALLPGTWQRIQDCTHLILVVGVLCCVALVVSTIIHIWNFSTNDFFITEALTIVFILPCTMYCIRIIGQYDDRLSQKQQHVKQEKENLTRTYNDLLTDMDGLLSKSTESSAGLAERSFESKRRDFQRFLERAKKDYGNIYKGSKGESDKLLKEFRRFCINWLSVFSECSIDPVHHPKHVVTVDELNRCTNIPDIADLCLERLRVTEVKFISQQRDQDQQLLRKNRIEARRHSVDPESRLALPAPAAAATAAVRAATGRMTWISCGCGQGFRCNRSETTDGFPREFRCQCCRVVILSKEHWMLMMGVLVGAAIIVYGIVTLIKNGAVGGTADRRQIDTLLMIFAEVCLLTMLIRFEELDIIQQLEREVRELEKQNKEVQQQREKMGEFWGNVQQLTELWLHRTVPRLDLYKEVHSQLEDTKTEDLLHNMGQANGQLEELEKHLGALDWWRGDGALPVDDKKRFGQAINQLCHEHNFEDLIDKLEDVIRDKTSRLQALPPPPAAAGKGS